MIWVAGLVALLTLGLALVSRSGSNLPRQPGTGECWTCGRALTDPARLQCPDCEADNAKPQTVRYALSAPAFCPHCRNPITEREFNRLHDELGRWRPGVFRRPCPECRKDIPITVREEP